MRTTAVLILALALTSLDAKEEIFSGPQVGEKLPAFDATLATGKNAGDRYNIVAEAKQDPLLIVFVHEVSRPAIGLTRLVINYGVKRKKEGLISGLVFLSDDVTETEALIRRARHALPSEIPIGISVDGKEGPGAYGLNRKVTLTVLVAAKGRVTANFALVQPSVAADAPRIGAAIAAVLGDKKKPTLADMSDGRLGGMAMDDEFRRLMAPVINRNAMPEEVKAAAKRVETKAGQNKQFKSRVGAVARRIIDAGRLPNYGTKTAQEFLQKWAKEYKDEAPAARPSD